MLATCVVVAGLFIGINNTASVAYSFVRFSGAALRPGWRVSWPPRVPL